MLKKFMSLALVVAMGISATACSKQENATNSKEPILIGHAVALTGGGAIWGQSEKNALDMEVEKINAAGGVLGRPIKIVSYDQKSDQTEAINVANRLVSDKVVAIVGPAGSGLAIAASSVTEPAKMIIISTTGTNVKVTVNDDGSVKPYTFRTCFIDPYQGKVAATFALNELKAKKAATLIDVGSDYSQGLKQYFDETFKAGGGQIVDEEAFRSDELDYRAQLGKIKNSGADILFIPTQQKEAGLAMKQARELGLKCQFMGGDGWASQELVDLGGSATEGAYFVNIASLEDPAIKTWLGEYIKKYGKEPTMPNPVLGIDALRMITTAIEATKSTDSTVLAKYMENIKDMQGMTGKLTIDPKTHNPLNKPAIIETVKDGKFKFYKSITPDK